MAKHDTWVELIDGHPFEAIEDLFPKGFPMRDPFPMGLSKDKDANGGRQIKLWYLDIYRLSDNQIDAIAELIAEQFDTKKQIILADAAINGLLVDHKWIERMWGDAENYQRTLELANFIDEHPNISAEDLDLFLQQQREDWIDGDRVPDPLPEKYEDVDPRIQHEELEEAYEIRRILSGT